MDVDDFDVVVTGTSPQRLTLKEDQIHEAPGSTNCSNLKTHADLVNSDNGSLFHLDDRGQTVSDQADCSSPARCRTSRDRTPDQRSSPTCYPTNMYKPATRQEQDSRWPGAPTVTMSPAHTRRRESTRLGRHAQSSSVDALHALKNSINSRFEADENQGSDANATASLPQTGLHLPAFERLMQVMTRLEKSSQDDNGDASSVISGQGSQTYRSPTKTSPANIRSSAALHAQRPRSATKSPGVASHPIAIGIAGSPAAVAPRPMLLHNHAESSALSYDLDQDTDVQQPWRLNTPSTFHAGDGPSDCQHDLLQREGSCTTAVSAAPPGYRQSVDHSTQSDHKEKVEPFTPASDSLKDDMGAMVSKSQDIIHADCEKMSSPTVHDEQQDGLQSSLHSGSDERAMNHEISESGCHPAHRDMQDHAKKEQPAYGLQSEQRSNQDDTTEASPFPGIPEVPWPSPGSALRSEDQHTPMEPKIQTLVQPQISLDWETVNTRLNAANLSVVQYEEMHDWHAFESSVHRAVLELISEYEKQGQVVQQLLSVADGASTEKTRHASALKALQRERDTLTQDLKREKEANNKRFTVQQKELEKTKAQVQALEGTIKKLHRDAEAAAKACSRQGMERQALETSTVSTQAEVSDLKKRVSILNETVTKAQAESKRLQGYSKSLEATQRVKDAQLTELEEHKRDSARRIDELERACALASKDAQQHESQVLSLQRQLKEAQVSIRNSERETDQQQGDISRLTTQLEMAEQRAIEAEATLREATGQMRSLTSRTTALEAQLRTRESEVEDLQATITNSQQGKSETESRGLQLQADLRSACADIANLTAQLGVQTAVARSREVEINELKSSIREAGVRQEAAGDALDDTVDENKRLSMQCAQLQCSLKTQVATLRARESELDDLRANYGTAEVKIDNLSQRLNMSGIELSKTDEALKLSQRQARSLGHRLNESEAHCQALQASLQTVEAKKGDVQVLNKNTAQQLAAARAEADRVKAALQAAEKQLAAKEDRISALHADLHILDAQKDELKHAVADASGAVVSASDNSTALESRVRNLLAQLKDRDEVQAVLKGQLFSLQTQRDRMEDSLKEHIKRDEASKSAQSAGVNRVDSLLLQLTARGEEVDALRSQLTLAEDTVREFKTKSAKAAAQLESLELSRQTQASRITVLTNQLRARDSVTAALKAQLEAMEEKQSSTQTVAEESHREMGRTDAMLAAERARAQELEKQLADAEQGQVHALNKMQTADADAREANDMAIETGRKCAHLEAQVKTLQGRISVLDAELVGAQKEEATLREALLESQSDRSSSALIASKENSALSSSLRASHARMVVLEKQLSERDQQITALRLQVSQAHSASGGAALQSRDAAAQVLAAEKRAQNLTARNTLMQTQLSSLQQEIEDLREALSDEKQRCNADSENAAQANTTMRALHAQISNLRSSVKVLEHQLSEKVDEAERLRAMLTMHDDSAQTAATAVVSAQLAESARDRALEDAKKRVSCLQRRLDMQQIALQDAQSDASAANDACDSARRQVAQYAAEVHRATLASHAATTYASGLESALKSADTELVEVRALLLKQNTDSGAANAETSAHTKGLESQIRSLHGRQQLLEKQVKDSQKALEKAEKATEDMKAKLEAVNLKATRSESELAQAQKQLTAARKAHEQTLAVSAERNAELEVLRNELSDLLINQDAMAQAGADSVKSEKVLRAGLRALDSELRSVHAALAKKDADALASDEALVNCRNAYRAAKSEAAAAHERCEVLRKQVRRLQSTIERHATAVQAAQDGAQDAQQAALQEAERADAVEAHVAHLEKVVHRFNLQQVALTSAQEKHDAAVTRAAEAVAEARKIAAAERENTTRARQNAVDAGSLVAAMQQEIQQLRSAHDVQLQASDAATAATKDLQQALLDQQAEVRVLAAEATGAAEHAASCSREVASLQAQLLEVKVQMHEQAEALVLAEQQLQDASSERVADKQEAIRTAESLQHADANVESLHRELEKKAEGVEDLRQQLLDTQALLQQEKQEHGVTRAQQATTEVALDRKSVSLQNTEAEKSRLAARLQHAEETIKEFTHSKLESTTQDAATRKAQHANEDRISALNQQLQSLTEIKDEQAQAIQDLEGSLAMMRVEAAQQQVADSAATAASARSEEKALQYKQQVVSLQQELLDVKKAKQGLEAKLAHESDERMKSSEELGRAAKAMLRAQKQIESLKKKGASSASALHEARAEIVTLKGAAMDAQMELKQSAVEGPHVRKLEAEVKSLRDKLREAQLQTSAEAEARQKIGREAGQLEDSIETAAIQLQRAEDEVAASQKESGNLKLQVTQLSHSLRECEKRLEKTREQLSASIAKEERFLSRGKQAYARIRAAWASAKGTNKVAGAIAAASREMRPVEIVSIYEDQKSQADAEVKKLSAENAVLLNQVRDLENKVTLANRELSNSGAPVTAELQAQLADASRTVSQLRAEVQKRDVDAGDAARMHARQLAEAQGRAEMLQEENATLLVELNNRPSHKDYTVVKREADIMRQRLSRMEARTENDSGGGHNAGSPSVDTEKHHEQRLMTTKDRIARDKQLAAMGLSQVDRLPHVVLAEIVQDACLALDVTEPTHLHAAILRVARRANQVAPLESFVESVCGCVFEDGADLVPEHLQDGEAASVVPILKLWQEHLHTASHVHNAMQQIGGLLRLPASQTLDAMVASVQELVWNQSNAQATLDTFKSLDSGFRNNPDAAIVKHFQNLFSVHSAVGCIPMMSKVYAEHQAGVTFLQALSDMLGIPRSSAACLDRVEALLKTSAGRELQLKQGLVGKLQPAADL